MSGIEVVFGAAPIARQEDWFPQAEDVLEKYGVKKIDTAQLYEGSEVTLAKFDAPSRFVIDTKWRGGFVPPDAPEEDAHQVAKDCLSRLGTKSVDIFYIHSPPPGDNKEKYLASINEAYKAGLFKRFGLSNFKVEDVQKIYDICKSKGYVLPTVYQGNYNPVARKQETVLLPTLRKLNIAFYVYSPIAGGFLTKTKQEVLDGAGRFDKATPIGKIYAGLYSKPILLEALAEWEEAAKEEGCTRAELAYRWVTFNSPLKPEYGDAIIIGASRLEQLEQTLKGLQAGPLSKNAAAKIDHIWSKIEHESPLDNYHG